VAVAALFMMIWCAAFIDQPGHDTTAVAKDPTCPPLHPQTPLMVRNLYTRMNVLASPIEPCAARSCPIIFLRRAARSPIAIFFHDKY
jgi:hypothetical protein